MPRIGGYVEDEETAFDDIDCEDCGLKFIVNPYRYNYQTPDANKCPRCKKGLPPEYEY